MGEHLGLIAFAVFVAVVVLSVCWYEWFGEDAQSRRQRRRDETAHRQRLQQLRSARRRTRLVANVAHNPERVARRG